MSRQRLLWACLCLFVPLSSAIGTPPSPSLEQLIRDLSHPKFAQREKATRELRERGEEAATALKASYDKLDAEGKDRARRILKEIEEETLTRKLLAPGQVHFQFKDEPLSVVLKELNAKTGLQFAPDAKSNYLNSRKVTFDKGELPLWEAVDQLLAAAGLTEFTPPPVEPNAQSAAYSGRVVRYYGNRPPNPEPTAAKITLVEGSRAVPADGRSSIRVKMLPVDHRINKKTHGSEEVVLGLEVLAPSSLSLRSILSIDIIKAQDEKGQTLVQKLTPSAEPSNNDMGMDGGLGQLVVLRGDIQNLNDDGNSNGLQPHQSCFTLNLGKRKSEKLEILTGRVNALVLLPEEIIAKFEDVKKLKEGDKSSPTSNLEIREVKVDKKGAVTLQCTFAQTCNMADQWGLNNAPAAANVGDFDFSSTNGLPRFTFTDQNGKPMRKVAQNIFGQSFGGNNQLISQVVITVVPEAGQEVRGLAISGRKMACLKVPFQLKQVPLP